MADINAGIEISYSNLHNSFLVHFANIDEWAALHTNWLCFFLSLTILQRWSYLQKCCLLSWFNVKRVEFILSAKASSVSITDRAILLPLPQGQYDNNNNNNNNNNFTKMLSYLPNGKFLQNIAQATEFFPLY